MTEALAHVDTAEAQFATVASDEEYESKQRDLQRMRDDIADLEVQLLQLQEEKTAAAALARCDPQRLRVQDRAGDPPPGYPARRIVRRGRGGRPCPLLPHARPTRHPHRGREAGHLRLLPHPVPPQTLSEIRHTTTVRTCVNCGCITIWDEAVS